MHRRLDETLTDYIDAALDPSGGLNG